VRTHASLLLHALLTARIFASGRPCVCIKPSANGLQMRTAQRTGLADSTCPTHVPEQDEPGICTGSWRVGTTTT